MVSGSGTSGDPYILSTFADLELIGSDATYTLAKYYKLGADIDASPTQDAGYNGGAGWSPRGTTSRYFTGSFDGNGYSISGLYINRGATDYIGLFGAIYSSLSIRDITLVDADITGKDYVGAFVGLIRRGTITNCNVTGDITGVNYVGGVCGRAYNSDMSTMAKSLINCSMNGNVTGTNYVALMAGGFQRGDNYITGGSVEGSITATGDYVGSVTGDLYSTSATASISGIDVSNVTFNLSSTNNYIGGIVGRLFYGHISDCSFEGDIVSGNYIGGVVGYGYNDGVNAYARSIMDCVVNANLEGVNKIGLVAGSWARGGDISSCDIRGSITATGDYIGGVVGYLQHTGTGVVSDFDIRDVTFELADTCDYVGGVAGQIYMGVIDSCRFSGVIECGGNYIGGIVGYATNDGVTSYDKVISNCATVITLSGASNVGGIVGYLHRGTNTVISSSFSMGSVNVTSDYGGGICGRSYNNISNCYSFVDVNANSYGGGLVGTMESGAITNSYSIGLVSGTSNLGGLVGTKNTGTATDCYWNTETSNQSSSALGTGKTTTEMLTQGTYTNYDFVTSPIWVMPTDCLNEGYPYLYTAQPLPTGSDYICVVDSAGTLTLEGIAPELVVKKFLYPSGIESGEAFGAITFNFLTGIQGIPSEEAFGTPTLIQEQFISPPGIVGGEGVPVPFLIFDQILTPISITTTETIGTPSIWHYDIYIFPEGISSEEEFGEAGWIGHVYIHIEADLTIQEPVTTIKVLNPDGGLNVKNTSQQHHINQPNTPLVLEAPWTDLKIYTEN